jgi:8-oxo-dGTP diphosphatase
MEEHFKLFSAVYLFIKNSKGQILLERRQNTGYMDGKLGIPAGHLDGGEGATTAAVREALEELAIELNPEDLKFTHLSHKPLSLQDPKEYLDLFFECSNWNGTIKINEPEKCSEQLWLTPDEFIAHPDAIPYLSRTLSLIQKGEVYSETI